MSRTLAYQIARRAPPLQPPAAIDDDLPENSCPLA